MPQFCRLCLLKIPGANFVSLNNEDAKAREVRAELAACLPELQQDLVKEPVICPYCVSVLHLTLTFKTQCFEVEGRLRHLKQNTKINVEDFTLTELFNMSDSSLEVNNLMIRELFTKNCKTVADESFFSNPHGILSIKKEYGSDEEKETNIYSTSLTSPRKQIKEQNDCQNLTSIAGLTARYEELTGATFISSSDSAVNKHELSQEMNYASEEITIKEEHELVTIKTEKSLKETKSTANVNVPIKECFVTIKRLPARSSNLINKSSFCVGKLLNSTSEKSLQNSTKKSRKLIKRERAERSFRCKICNFVTITKQNLLEHTRMHIGKKGFCCNICEFSATDKGTLVRHMQTHSRIKPFHCDVCEYSAARKGTLAIHMQTHSGEKPFPCNICEYSTARKANLIIHMRTHTSEKPYRCKFCAFRAAHKGTLVIHVRSHTGEKPFHCKICEFSTAQRVSLVRHVRTHTGEKPFQCNICKFRAARTESVVRHMRTHTGEKPFRCNVCEFSAAQKGNLITHMLNHTSEKPLLHRKKRSAQKNSSTKL